MPDTALQVRRLPHAADLPLPAYQAAGLDLMAAVDADTPLVITPGRWAPVPTGLVIALPEGTEGQVRPRSGLAARHGVTVLNAPGTIDADYRGEVQVLLVNLGAEPFTVTRGTLRPVFCQALLWAHAARSTHSPSGTINPVSSATGMNSTGPTSPRSGCAHRSRASAPIMRLSVSRCRDFELSSLA